MATVSSARREAWPAGGGPARRPLPSRDPRELMDEVLTLREANQQLKKRNAEQEEKTKQLATKMVRITSDMKRHGGPVETPAGRAAARDASKEQQIDELRAQLAQMEGKNEKLSNQVAYYKTISAAPGTRISSAGRRTQGQRKALLAVPGAHAPNDAHAGGAETPRSASADRERPEVTPRSAPHTPRSATGTPRRRMAGGAAAEEGTSVARLLELLEAKERQIEVLKAGARAALSPPPRGSAMAGAAAAAALEPGAVLPAESIAAAVRAGLEEHRVEMLQAPVGPNESATVVELRRLVREKGAQGAHVQQKLDHLTSRFEALRANHDKAVSQLQELNRLLREERIKSSRLEQEAALRQSRAEEADELRTLLSAQQHAARLLEEENKQLVERALSEADSTEIGALRRELAERQRVAAKLHSEVKRLEEEGSAAKEALRSQEHAAANLRAELAVLNRGRERLLADLESERSLAARYQEQLALYTGDAGVSPAELMKALAVVRQGTEGGAASGRPLDPLAQAAGGPGRGGGGEMLSADEDTLLRSLPPAQRRHVQGVLVANSELILEQSKAEHLLSLAQGMNAALREELDAARLEHNEAMAVRARQLDAKEAEIAQLRKELVLRPGGLASIAEAERAGFGAAGGSAAKARSGRLTSRVPGSGASVAPSSISEGETAELNVRDDENMFELHVLAADLSREFFPGSAPRTFVAFDFYSHESHTTAMADGHAPAYDLLAQYIVSADDLLLHYLRTHSLALELHQVRATEEVLVGRATAGLAVLLSPAFHQAASTGILGGGSGGRIKLSLPIISVDGLGQTLGTLKLTMRMRRPMDNVLVPFYRRFPELTTPPTAIAPRELIVRVLGCRGLKPAGGGGPPLAPYVFYSFYEFGDYETPAGAGENPAFASTHAFVIDVRSRRLRDELRRRPLRFTVLDDDDSVVARTDEPIGHADIDLSALIEDERPIATEWQLHDSNGLPTGSLLLSISLGKVPSAAVSPLLYEDEDTHKAAIKIQANVRGRYVRRSGVGAIGARGLRVRVGLLELSAKALADESVGALWVEVDLLGLQHAATPPMRTATLSKGDGREAIDFGLQSDMPVPVGSAAERILGEALQASLEEDADVYFVLHTSASTGGGSRQLASARINLQEMLRRDSEQHSKRLVLSEGYGWLTVSLIGLPVLKLLGQRKAAPTGSEGYDVRRRAPAGSNIALHIVSLSLEPRIYSDSKIETVGVEAELLDLDDATALKTPMLPKGDGRRPLAFDFKSDVRVEAGTAREKLLYDALASTDKQDSDIVFFVFAAGRDSQDRKPIGEASVNMERMLEARRDERDAKLKVISMDGKQTIGSMVVSVTALDTLLRVDELNTTPRGRTLTSTPQRPEPSARSGPASITVHIASLELEPSFVRGDSFETIGVDVELLDLDDATALKTPMLPKGDGRRPLAFDFKSDVRLESDTAREKLLWDALASTDKQDSDIVFFVFTAGRNGRDRKQVGEASVNMERMLEAQRDERDAKLKVISMDGKQTIGSMVVSVTALDTLLHVKALRVAPSGELPSTPAAVKPATPSAPRTPAAADASSEAIKVEIASLTLESSMPGFAVIETVGVEAELLDLDDATALKTPMLPKGDGRRPLAFDFKSDVRVEAGTAREKLLWDALASTDKQDSDIVFFVFTAGRNGRDRKQVGEASVNMERMLEAQRDERDAKLKVISMDGKQTIGSMVVSVTALDTLLRVKALRNAPTGSAVAATPDAAPLLGADDAITVHVNSLLLEPALAKDRTVENLAVEVEFLDLDDATALKTETLPKGDGLRPLLFGFRSNVRVEPGEPREKQLRAALNSPSSEAADVAFYVYASGRGGSGRKELGEAIINLQRMRDTRRDERDVSLSVVSAADGTKVGTLVVSVFAAATLARVAPTGR